MTPAAVEERYFVAPGRYPELAALVGESSDNLPGIPGVGPKTAAKWLTTYDGLENLITHAGELKGKAADAFKERIEAVRLNRQVNALIRDLDLPMGIDDFGRQPWDREATHQLFDQLEFRVLRDRLLEALPNEEIVPEGGFELSGVVLEPGELSAWLDEHAAGDRTGLDVIGHWGSGTGDIRAIALAAGDGAAAYVDVDRAPAADENALAAWLADPTKRKAMHDAKGPLLALWARGWELAGLTSDTQLAAYLVRPDQRTFDLADLTIRYLKRELKVDAGPDALDTAADQLALDFGDDDSGTRGRGSGGDGAVPRSHRPGRRARRRRGGAQRDQPAVRGGAAAAAHAGADGADRGGRRHRPAGGAGSRVRLHRQPGRRRGVPDPRQADQPRLAQAAAGGAVRRAEDAEDPADPDGLHHRRRGVAAALRQDRAPVPRPDADPPGRDPAPADRRGSAQVGRRRRPDPHHLRADHRRDRSALQHRPEPAEHPDPHRGGTPDPGGVRGGRGLRVPDECGLLADRDAHHGPRQRGREPDRGVQVGHGLPHRHGVAGLRGRSRRGLAGRAGQDQGDELRAGVRAQCATV